MHREITYYRDDRGVQITNRRVVMNGTTYVLANLTSTRVDKRSSSPTPRAILFLALITFASFVVLPGLGFVVLVVLALYLKGAFSTTHVVSLGSASGEVDALETQDEQYAHQVSRAINEAFIEQGAPV